MENKKQKTAYKATHEFKRRNYDTILLSMPKGSRDRLKQKAAEQGVALSRYILEAVEQRSGLKLTLDNALPWMNPGTKN